MFISSGHLVPADNVDNLVLQDMSHAAENLRSTVFEGRMGGNCYLESRTLRVGLGAVAMCQKMSIEIQANLSSGAAATSWHSTDGDSERYWAIVRSSGGHRIRFSGDLLGFARVKG